jgi:hypothetical protein
LLVLLLLLLLLLLLRLKKCETPNSRSNWYGWSRWKCPSWKLTQHLPGSARSMICRQARHFRKTNNSNKFERWVK